LEPSGLRIRQEIGADYDAVYSLVKVAFATMPHADGNEQDLVVALRQSEVFVPELSLVAELDGRIVGHILFTKANIGERTELCLAPLAVLPEYQKRGVGSALIHEGHRIARELGYAYSVLVGHETYYPRFGYVPAESLGIDAIVGIPSVNFMAAKLRDDGGPVGGAVTFAPEFGL
jgi:predicted N-acetyltransferase YhbS